MLIEVLGQYQLELSAMQLIQNGGWVAYAAIRTAAQSPRARPNILPYQRIGDEAVFESEAAAIAGARRAAMAMLASGDPAAFPPR